MNRTLAAVWTIIAGSIVAVVTLAFVWNNEREKSARLGLADLLTRQLDAYNRDVARVFEEYELKLQRQLEDFDPTSKAEIFRLERDPLVGQLIVVGDRPSKGALLYPDVTQKQLSESSLVADAVLWIRDNRFFGKQSASPAAQQSYQTFNSSATDRTTIRSNLTESTTTHWTTWYHQRGLVLGYWTRSSRDTVTMVIVPRGRWLADVVATLPDNQLARDDALIQLLDFEGNVMTQWGNLELVGDEVKDAELAVVPPLEGWRLRMTLSAAARNLAQGTSYRITSGIGALGFSAALLLLGILVTTNLNRQLQLARQQVSFVNQVSHELRTPLTNIRMYADLAINDLQSHSAEGVSEELQKLSVIQQESERLGRLIDNVLSFARMNRGPHGDCNMEELRLQPVDHLDLLIDEVLATFAPQISERGMQILRSGTFDRPLKVDRELVEQILVNLISNALKYAASGKILRIDWEWADGMLILDVVDQGPGIPARLRERVFQPFMRVHHRLEDPTGTGIGLSIARSLARRHGGDCTLEPSMTGCRFRVQIRCEAI